MRLNPCGTEGQKQMRETTCCHGLSTGIQAQNRGGKGLETSSVEVILSIHGRNTRDSSGKFGNCICNIRENIDYQDGT